MARHIGWARSLRKHSAFTTWQGTFGSGPRTVTTTVTRRLPPTGARTRPLRATPRQRTVKAIASELIAAARGCFRRGCCDRLPENAILPTIAMRSWASASQKRCREDGSLSLNQANVYEKQIFSPPCCSGGQLRVHCSSCANKPIDDESDCCSRIRWTRSLKIRRHTEACAKRKRDVDSCDRCRSQSCR